MSYNEKVKELQEKYSEIITAISRVEKVDLGVAFDMFKKNIKLGTDYGWNSAEEEFDALEKLAKEEMGLK